MKYLSVCSGIEAATVAWHGLGWKAAAYSEIEPFPSAVLAHHYPDVPNVGDMTNFKEWNIEPGSIDLLVGGTPCQSFSVAGLRKGLDDPRGNLMLTYLAIARQYRPRWLVWENVPGVLSSNGGLDFASLLRGMGECGYGFAYRILDAQYFGVPQRRRRVFVVGYLGDWRAAAAVLFERHSLSGHPAPSREKGKEVAGTFTARAKSGGWGQDPNLAAGGYMRPVCPTLRAGGNSTGGDRPPGTDVDTADSLIVQPYPIANTLTARMHKGINSTVDEVQTPVVSFHPTQDPISSTEVFHSIGANENATAAVMQPIGVFQDSEFGVQQYDSAGTLRAGRIPEHQMVMQPVYEMHGQDSRVRELGDVCSTVSATYGAGGGNVPVTLQPIPLNSMNALRDANADPSTGCGIGEAGEAMFTITKGHSHAVAQSVALRGREGGATAELGDDVQNCLRASQGGGDKPHVLTAMQVRRLTPVECERLQGFPDNYTAIPWRKKPADDCPDGPRYKALGNSMAVPVMAWIGKRIQEFEAMNAS